MQCFDAESDLDMSHQSVPLNHSAAHHKNAIKPKRTHGAPRRRKVQQVCNRKMSKNPINHPYILFLTLQLSPSVLPSTPEVNEDVSLRSLTPETIEKGTIHTFTKKKYIH